MLQQTDHFEAGALLIEVIQLRGMASILKAFIDALALGIEDAHPDLAEGRTVMSKGTVAKGWTRNGSEPAVEYGKVGGQ